MPDLSSYKSLKNNVGSDAKNVAMNESACRSASFNLAVEDAAPMSQWK